ncbi:MAG: hypothetical protein SGI86_04625 [Deltaproteobacteria bacterium]|nr:hypothetical protein [Deltaproteobacteria bacterium]
MVSRKHGLLVALLLYSTLGLAANCGGGDTRKGDINIGPGGGGSAGDASGDAGGSTGKKTGGTDGSKTGGTTAGGSGGTSTGGASGMATGGVVTGGMGGTATGGVGGMSTGGMGGTATGGTAGSNTGGTGGTVSPPTPGPIAVPTSKDFFSGKGATISTVVSGDAMPGYFYATGSFAIVPTVNVTALAAADRAGLPAGVTHAQRSDNPLTGGLLIVGWNFRANDGATWRWIDATAYAGITLWAKTGNPAPLSGSFTSVDAKNILTSDPIKGTCAAAPCVAVPGTPINVTPTWQQFKIKFADLVQEVSLPAAQKGPVDVKQLGRIDILFGLESNVNADLFITGVALATAADLQ